MGADLGFEVTSRASLVFQAFATHLTKGSLDDGGLTIACTLLRQASSSIQASMAIGALLATLSHRVAASLGRTTEEVDAAAEDDTSLSELISVEAVRAELGQLRELMPLQDLQDARALTHEFQLQH